VRIDVEGQAYVGVSQKLLHELWVYALPEQECGARVAQVVEAGLLGEFCAPEQGFEGAVEVAARQVRIYLLDTRANRLLTCTAVIIPVAWITGRDRVSPLRTRAPAGSG